jgi:hypothetical protein
MLAACVAQSRNYVALGGLLVVDLFRIHHGSARVCVCVYILHPAEHVLKARVLETPVEYRTLGGKPLDIYLV